MIPYLAKRFGQALFILIGITLVTYILLFLVPADPVRQIAGRSASPETVESIRRQLGLDLPLWQQYLRYLGHLAQGDLGRSYIQKTEVTTLILAFGFAFQMPVVMSLAGRAGIISAQQLRQGRRYAIVGIFVFAAFVTPPDPFSQIILGLAILGLYEMSIIAVRLVEKRREQDEASEATAEAAG